MTSSKDLSRDLIKNSNKMSLLPAGTYTMRVTLEDGKAYSDKVVKE